MNAYFVDAGIQEYEIEYIGSWSRCESEFLCDIVYAETRGYAKSLFHKEHNGRCYIEFTDINAVILKKDTNMLEGFAEYDDILWNHKKINNIVNIRG